MSSIGAVILVLGALVYAGLVGLILVVVHGGTRDNEDDPALGADVSDDDGTDGKHAAWLRDGEPPA